MLDEKEKFFIFVPSHFCNISVKSLEDFWMNEDETEGITEEKKENEIDPGEIETSSTFVIRVCFFLEEIFYLCFYDVRKAIVINIYVCFISHKNDFYKLC